MANRFHDLVAAREHAQRGARWLLQRMRRYQQPYGGGYAPQNNGDMSTYSAQGQAQVGYASYSDPSNPYSKYGDYNAPLGVVRPNFAESGTPKVRYERAAQGNFLAQEIQSRGKDLVFGLNADGAQYLKSLREIGVDSAQQPALWQWRLPRQQSRSDLERYPA